MDRFYRIVNSISAVILIVGLSYGALVVVIGVRDAFKPADWVELHLEHVPESVDKIFVVARRQDTTFPLGWYFFKVLAWSGSSHDVGEMWYTNTGRDQRKGDVRWASADSYGILARLKSGKWVLWWLEPKFIAGPSNWRYLFGGGETVVIQTLGIESAEDAPDR